ncbi:hypothetical protein [Asticcacaulis machinosus]|uniref:Uncharacterized protein n=1 Tax=Asticcacaulis machinosus TaxID=2984211 RepID=A0ABT5HH07_9CAUL|nr:hypothetical protein [Asticcacaulis machinosus]MDC7675531.1 hypothetical protein [Asticcacaulis machinosus]
MDDLRARWVDKLGHEALSNLEASLERLVGLSSIDLDAPGSLLGDAGQNGDG